MSKEEFIEYLLYYINEDIEDRKENIEVHYKDNQRLIDYNKGYLNALEGVKVLIGIVNNQLKS